MKRSVINNFCNLIREMHISNEHSQTRQSKYIYIYNHLVRIIHHIHPIVIRIINNRSFITALERINLHHRATR